MEEEEIDDEKFVDIKGIEYHDNYEINRNGQIRHKINKDILKSHLDKDGYPTFSMSKNGMTKQYRIHRLMALTFINNPDNKTDVNHIDGNRTNYNINNLEWVSRSENNYKSATSRSNKTGYKGVFYNKENKCYCAYITINKKRTYIGNTFETAEEANNARKAYELKHLGHSCEYNSKNATEEDKNKKQEISILRKDNNSGISGLKIIENKTCTSYRVQTTQNKKKIGKTFKTREEAIQFMKDNGLYKESVKTIL